jgi:ferrous iron transport protein B
LKRILLVGNPNVGKSVIFSNLTGVNVACSNYPGTTVEYCAGLRRIGGSQVEIIDVPGAYSLEPTSKAEVVAVDMIDSGDVIVNVVDATAPGSGQTPDSRPQYMG